MGTPLLSRPGAVADVGADAGVAAHYGDPLREQRAAVEGAALVDRSNRGVVAVSGADRLSWLHSLTSQHLSELPAYQPTEALILSPHGHVEHHLVIVDDGTTTYADVEPGTTAALVAFLDSMRFMLRVDVTDLSDELAVLSLVGPDAAAVAAAVEDAMLRRPMSWPLAGSVDLLVPWKRIDAAADQAIAAGATLAGRWAFEALRIAARRPRLGVETDHRTIPHEVGWLETAVHLDKGCYRGQETVARVNNLGRPPRRLVLLHLDGSADRLPIPGEAVEWEGVPVGFVGGAARHYELGAIALALVKRKTPDDAALVVSGIAASIDQPDGSVHALAPGPGAGSGGRG